MRWRIALKKKHNRTGEESRYQGTVLGRVAEGRPVKIEGGPDESIQEWAQRMETERQQAMSEMGDVPTPSSTVLSDPLTMEEDQD